MQSHRLLAALVAVLLVGTACGQAAAPASAPAPAAAASAPASPARAGASAKGCNGTSGQPVRFADNQFQTLWINNAIAKYIVEHGFCTPAKSITLSTPLAEKALAGGQVDVWMEMWQQNWAKFYKQATASGQIVNLGHTYDRSTQGWYVPKYVVSGDAARGIKPMAPGLKSVSDLKRYWKVFKDPNNPHKGLFINCISSWECYKINRIKMRAYGLDKYYNSKDPGSPAALVAAIVGAYKKGQPVLAYYWAPTWLLGKYDMVQIKEPPYSKACNAEIDKFLKSSSLKGVPASAGCAYESLPIDKGVSARFDKHAPGGVIAFLKKMDVGNKPLEKTAAYMQTHKATADQAATWFFEHYQKRWESWLPKGAASRVRQALVAQGAKFAS